MSSPALLEGQPFLIGQAIVAALRASPALSGALVLDNPVRAQELADGDRIVFFEDGTDRPNGDQPNQSPRRVYGFSVGVIRRGGTDVRKAAHTDYRAAMRVVRASMPAIQALGVALDGSGLVHGQVVYRLENIDLGGSLVLGTFTVDYRDPG